MAQSTNSRTRSVEEIVQEAIREDDHNRLNELAAELDRALDVAAFDLLLEGERT